MFKELYDFMMIVFIGGFIVIAMELIFDIDLVTLITLAIYTLVISVYVFINKPMRSKEE